MERQNFTKIKTVANYLASEECTGCGACKNKCPFEAITMEKDKDGFYRYHVNEEKCVDCGLCKTVCPVINPVFKNTSNPDCYAMWAPNQLREISSSGGFFSVAADYILGREGYVCGVVYKEDFTTMHILTNSKQEYKRMRGSKYIQSDTQMVYSEIKNVLECGKEVLFTGLPCHVAGLNAYLGKNYEHLFTIDLICHGITSVKVFEKYVKDVLINKELKCLEFKKKTPWGW